MSRSAIRSLFAALLVVSSVALTGCDTPSTPKDATPGTPPTANYPSGPADKGPAAPK